MPEQIITALREAEVGLANGKTVGMVNRDLGISEQTYYRWRQEFGGMKVDQARRFKELEKENACLKRAVANLTVDKLILEEAARTGRRARPCHRGLLRDQWIRDERDGLRSCQRGAQSTG